MSEAELKETNENVSNKKYANGPVYFLIREQAKSVVAIKDLQARLAVLEDLQERLMQAVENVQQHLTTNKTIYNDTQDDSHYATAVSNYSKLSESRGNSSNTSEVESKQELLALDSTAKADSKGGSINKDSGVISDYKGSVDSSYVPYNSTEKFDNENDDELLKLLDIIDQKSLMLLQQVEDVGIKPSEATAEDKSIATSHTNSYIENVITQRQLCEVKADRDDLRQRLVKLEMATDAVVKEKKKLQKQLESIATENHELQTKIQNTDNVGNVCVQLGESYSMAEMQKASVRQKYMQYSEKSRKKVATVLKETQVLELQRQLLTYIMENDVLQAKLEQSQPSNWLTWLKLESRLKKELQNSNKDRVLLENSLREKQAEIAVLRRKIKSLEESLEQKDTVENFGLKSTDDWRQPSENQKGNFSALSPLDFGDFSKTQSLPAAVRLDTQGCPQVMFEQNFNAKNFREISLSSSHSEEKEYFSSDNSKNLLDLTDDNESETSNTSRLMHLRYWNQPAISAEWSTAGSLGCSHHHQSSRMCHQNFVQQNSLKSKNSKLSEKNYWKGNNDLNDLDSICTEFDPLNSVPSCENFVDSLNLSIPLKPTQIVSQLSSVGDSLHSASLDLGCASSSTWLRESEKLTNTNSIDGIRKVYVNTNITNLYKSRTSQNSVSNYTSTPSKHPRPLNIMGYFHND